MVALFTFIKTVKYCKKRKRNVFVCSLKLIKIFDRLKHSAFIDKVA